MGSLSERIMEGLNVSLICMTITILSLFLLSLTIVILSKIINSLGTKQTGGSNTTSAGGLQDDAAIAQSPNQTTAAIPDETDNAGARSADIPGGELVAVLAAAIAYVTGADASSFRIVSYRRTRVITPVWNARGRYEYLSGKL